MKIILLADVVHVGKKNEVREVRDGFARNFLLPRRLALPATAQTEHAVVAKKDHDEKRRSIEQERYRRIAERLESLHVVIKAKIGEKGKAFGSVSAAKIVDELKAQHHVELKKEWFHLDEPLKSTGTKEVPVRFPHGVEGKVMVNIEAEGEET